MTRLKDSFLNYLTLFSSTGTLLCCALPALLVSLGLGAVIAGLANNIPGLIWISEHKINVFIFAGTMLALNGFIIFKDRNAPCLSTSSFGRHVFQGESSAVKSISFR